MVRMIGRGIKFLLNHTLSWFGISGGMWLYDKKVVCIILNSFVLDIGCPY